jgi:phospholipid/cholesterol/gamma-HCH transport system permease protein
MHAASKPAFEVALRPDGSRLVALTGSWRLDALRPELRSIEGRLAELGRRQGLWWDLTGVEALDTLSAAVLLRAWLGLKPPGLIARPEQEALIDLLVRTPVPERPRAPGAGDAVAAVGERVLDAVGHVSGTLALLGQLVLDLVAVLRRPNRAPWKEWSASLYRAGASALPITALVGFLIGVVVSYLSAQQLRTFGANIFIVNLLGISILRELGPLLAAILVAGRSGSSITAQIGVMRLTQELDALAAMGISASRRLVLPRVLALAVALPLLVLWTDILALAGGILAAEQELGVGVELFLDRLPDAVPVSNLWLGLTKGAVFGVVIGVVACHFGLRVEPNTRSLGAGTTRSVVVAITLVIVADAVFAVITSQVGLP